MAKAATNHHVVGHKGAKATRFHFVVVLPCGKKASYVIPLTLGGPNSKENTAPTGQTGH